jgi:hypothetical protein
VSPDHENLYVQFTVSPSAERYCPAKWIWLKVVFILKAFIKGRGADIFSELRPPLSLCELFKITGLPRTIIVKEEPNCQWRTQIQLRLLFYIVQGLAKARRKHLELIAKAAVCFIC